MRIAALIAGALAGFLAALVIALGGVDVSGLVWLDPRQMAMARFALILVANMNLLAAGVALAVPRAAMVLFVLSALAWIGSTLALGHNLDVAQVAPASLSFLAAILATADGLLRRRTLHRAAIEALEEPLLAPIGVLPVDQSEAGPDDDDEAEVTSDMSPAAQLQAAIAGNFSGPALRPVNKPRAAPPLLGLDERGSIPGRLSGRERTARRVREPAGSPFREPPPAAAPERFGRRLAGIASFALYAVLAATAGLALINLYQAHQSASPPERAEAKTVSKSPSAKIAEIEASARQPVAVAKPAPAAPAAQPALPPNPGLPDPVTETTPPAAPVRTIAETPPPQSENVVVPPIATPAPVVPAPPPADISTTSPAAGPQPAPDAEISQDNAGIDPALAPPVPAQMGSELALARRQPASGPAAPLSDL